MGNISVLTMPSANEASTSTLVIPSACTVSVLRSEDRHAWEMYVRQTPGGTLFHTLAWRDAVEGAFGHSPVYLVARRAGRMVGGLPLFHVASRIAGNMLVSVPYGVGGGVVADDNEATLRLFDAARDVARERNCSTIDLRSERPDIPGIPVVDRYVGFERTLPSRADDVLAWLPRKARAAARNGRDKYGLTTHYGDEHLREVWRLYSRSMRRLASLTYPYAFFEGLVEGTPTQHWVSLVRWRGRPVAGLVTFLFNDRVMPYFLGTTDEARRCSATNFIYLETMERAVHGGYRVFDFGRSRRDNVGSVDFKRFNGFSPRSLNYQLYTRPGFVAPQLSPDHRRFRLARRLWPHLPLGVTRFVGAKMARHIPG